MSPPERRRIYSNTGIEMVADAVAAAAGMPFADYVGEAVFVPLGMDSCELRGLGGACRHGRPSGDVIALPRRVAVSDAAGGGDSG